MWPDRCCLAYPVRVVTAAIDSARQDWEDGYRRFAERRATPARGRPAPPAARARVSTGSGVGSARPSRSRSSPTRTSSRDVDPRRRSRSARSRAGRPRCDRRRTRPSTGTAVGAWTTRREHDRPVQPPAPSPAGAAGRGVPRVVAGVCVALAVRRSASRSEAVARRPRAGAAVTTIRTSGRCLRRDDSGCRTRAGHGAVSARLQLFGGLQQPGDDDADRRCERDPDADAPRGEEEVVGDREHADQHEDRRHAHRGRSRGGSRAARRAARSRARAARRGRRRRRR